MSRFSFLVTLMACMAFATQANSTDLVKEIVRFHENPSEVMNVVPEKTPVVGDESMLDNMISPLGHKPLGLGDIVEIKDEQRSVICRIDNGIKVCGNDQIGRAGIQPNDRFESLVDYNQKPVNTLEQIEERSLLKKELTIQPWSDDYWPLANGVLAHRYAHESGEKEFLWQEALNKFKATPTQSLIDDGLVHQLSPAEKYDLLIGDRNFTLTNSMLNEGKPYFDRNGSVESWMGICHGWAAAAYMLPRPKKVIWVKSFDGKLDIPFYPSDIKSLGSLLYAKNDYPSKFIGGRCNVKDPKQDENGRVTDQRCFDNNPATWHFAVINQIGVSDRSMVMDATFDYEVWNQPIISYDISYYNPQEMKYVNNLKDAKSSLKEFTKDKFKKYRHKNTRSIIGIEMDVKYIVETSPSHQQMDSPHYDGIKEVTYQYDLEIDSTGNVIGGEWYTNLHPDFLWTPIKNRPIQTQTDKFLASRGVFSWNINSKVPSIVQQFVSYESRRGSPLAMIVQELFRASSK